MEDFDSIRSQISRAVGIEIPKKGWDATFNQLDRMGKLDHKTVVRLVIIIAKKLEEYEQNNKQSGTQGTTGESAPLQPGQ